MRGSENKIWPRCSLLILVVINANFCRKSRVTADKFTLKLIIFTHYTNRQFLYDFRIQMLCISNYYNIEDNIDIDISYSKKTDTFFLLRSTF